MDGYLGEIRMFAGNYAPEGWALCDGSLLQIASYEALFTLLGTTYGGNGSSTFGLPDLRGRAPMSVGTGTGLSARTLGAAVGVETVTLAPNNQPAHTHTMAAGGAGTTNTPEGKLPASVTGFNLYAPATTAPGVMANAAITSSGGNAAHNNMMPTVCINFIIALTGLYPTPN